MLQTHSEVHLVAQPTFLPRGDVGTEVDVPERAAANLAAESVLVSHP